MECQLSHLRTISGNKKKLHGNHSTFSNKFYIKLHLKGPFLNKKKQSRHLHWKCDIHVVHQCLTCLTVCSMEKQSFSSFALPQLLGTTVPWLMEIWDWYRTYYLMKRRIFKYVVFRRFKKLESLYTTPLESKDVNVNKVGHLDSADQISFLSDGHKMGSHSFAS